MKKLNIFIPILLFALAFNFSSCMQETEWLDDYDVTMPIPEITAINATRFNVKDTVDIEGSFEKLSIVTIGGGFAKIHSLSDDNKSARIVVTETCMSGSLIIQNLYKKKFVYPTSLVIIGGGTGPVTPGEVIIMDFSKGVFFPSWTKSEWTEAKDFEEVGYDLNNDDLPLPNGYEHCYAMNDKDLFPPSQPSGQGGNIPYGTYSSDNDGSGFDISYYSDPYVSILMNTGEEDIAYMSIVIDDLTVDLSSSQCEGGVMANGETKSYMKTDGKWLWYSFSLDKITGGKIPTNISSAGLFIRNSWDYGADIYPGFQLNIIQMVVTDGPLPEKVVLFDFEDEDPTTTNIVTAWATDVMGIKGRNLGELTSIPSGDSYYTMQNIHEGGGFNYNFALKNDNGGDGFYFNNMKNPHITFAINTGSYSGFIDFVFYQAASGNKEAEPWADPGANNSAVDIYSEAIAQEGKVGFYFDTKGQWEWRTYDLIKLLNGVEEWGKQGGKYPNFEEVFDYILLWPRDGWNNELAAQSYEVNLDNIIITDGLPTGLPELNK